MESDNVLKMKAKASPSALMPLLRYGPCSMCWWARQKDTLRCFVDPPDVIFHAFPHRNVVNPKAMGVNFAFQGVRPSTEPDDTCVSFLDRRVPLAEVEKALTEGGQDKAAQFLHSHAPQSPLPSAHDPSPGDEVAGPSEGARSVEAKDGA